MLLEFYTPKLIGKMFDLLNKEILFKQARTQLVMQLKSTHCLHL